MSLTFQKGSTLVLSNGSSSRKLLLESVSASQTYLEESRSVKTIQTPNNIQDTGTNSKSTVSVEFTCPLTNDDGMLLEWFGLLANSSKYFIQPASTIVPTYTLYIISGSTIYQISNTYASSMSILMDKERPLSVSISATGSNLTSISTPPVVNSTQSSDDFMYGSLNVAGYSNIAGVTLEFTKSISWINDKTIQTILAGLYYSSKAVCDELAIGGTLTFYKRDSVLAHQKYAPVDITYGDSFKIYLDSCKLLDRWDLASDIHKKMTDYKAQPTAMNSFILMNGDSGNIPLTFILDAQGLLVSNGPLVDSGELYDVSNN